VSDGHSDSPAGRSAERVGPRQTARAAASAEDRSKAPTTSGAAGDHSPPTPQRASPGSGSRRLKGALAAQIRRLLRGGERLVDSADHVARLVIAASVVAAAIALFTQRAETEKQTDYQAWQVINSANGQSSSGGRITALEDLNNDGCGLLQCHHRVSLAGLSARGANLASVDLPGAILTRALLDGADLQRAQLEGAHLDRAGLRQADLSQSNLAGAGLTGASLQGSLLFSTDLSGADLRLGQVEACSNSGCAIRYVQTNLSNASLSGANLSGAELESADARHAVFMHVHARGVHLAFASLQNADFQGADLRQADLRDADLLGAKLGGADITGANFQGAVLSGPAQILKALHWQHAKYSPSVRAQLP
jgi:uncharacterized protein YjbI with pentapeptide repeats